MHNVFQNHYVRIGITLLALPLSGIAETIAADSQQQSGYAGYVAGGVGYLPEYEGAEAYDAVPLIAGRVQHGTYYVETDGMSLRANLSANPAIEFGPMVSVRLSRKANVENNRVARLREIDTAVEGGAFITLPIQGVLRPDDTVALTTEVTTDLSNTHEGTLATVKVGYNFSPTEKWRVGASVATTYASEEYHQTYFSIDANNAARSGLGQYQADSGLKDAGVTLNTNYSLNERWGVMALAGYNHLLGDASDSPIVKTGGSSGQAFGGIGLSYRF